MRNSHDYLSLVSPRGWDRQQTLRTTRHTEDHQPYCEYRPISIDTGRTDDDRDARYLEFADQRARGGQSGPGGEPTVQDLLADLQV